MKKIMIYWRKYWLKKNNWWSATKVDIKDLVVAIVNQNVWVWKLIKCCYFALRRYLRRNFYNSGSETNTKNLSINQTTNHRYRYIRYQKNKLSMSKCQRIISKKMRFSQYKSSNALRLNAIKKSVNSSKCTLRNVYEIRTMDECWIIITYIKHKTLHG